MIDGVSMCGTYLHVHCEEKNSRANLSGFGLGFFSAAAICDLVTFSAAFNLSVTVSFCLSVTSLRCGVDTVSDMYSAAFLLPPVICHHHVVASLAALSSVV